MTPRQVFWFLVMCLIVVLMVLFIRTNMAHTQKQFCKANPSATECTRK